MLTSTRTRADDVRALVGAIVLGSSAGLVVGVGYLAGGAGAKPALRPAPVASAPLQAVIAPPARSATMRQASGPAPLATIASAESQGRPAPSGAQAPRDRIQAASTPPAAAQPFRFRQVAEAPSDLHCLTEAVYFEARGEAPAGQQAVAQVVLNRVRHPAFPKTICAVVHQHSGSGCQFTFACSNRQAAMSSVAWRRAETIASSELHGAVMSAVGDATQFQAARASPFAGLLKVAQIGAHIFYRFGGRAGAPSMFHQTPGASSEPVGFEVAKLEPAPKPVQPVAVDQRIKLVPAATPAAPQAATVKPEGGASKPTETAAVGSSPVLARSVPAPTPVILPAKPAETSAAKPAILSGALSQSSA